VNIKWIFLSILDRIPEDCVVELLEEAENDQNLAVMVPKIEKN
jgi:hypothetical protein